MALEDESQTRTSNQDFILFSVICLMIVIAVSLQQWWLWLCQAPCAHRWQARQPLWTQGHRSRRLTPPPWWLYSPLFKVTRSTFPNFHHRGCTLFLFKPAHLTFANFQYHGCTRLSTLDNHTPLDQRAVAIFTPCFLFVFASLVFFRAYCLKHLTLFSHSLSHDDSFPFPSFH